MSRVTQEYDDLDLTGAPVAFRTRWFKCDHCEHLHVVLHDEDDAVIAAMVLDVEMLTDMLDVAKGPPTAHKETRQ